MKKQILSIILIFCIFLNFIPAFADTATSDLCGENVTWTLADDGTLTISGSGEMYDYTWTRHSPFYGKPIKSVIIEEGVTTVGNYAFDQATQITDVTIANSVISIGGEAFESCTRLENIIIGKGVEKIGSSAFFACRKLKSITIPDSVTTIGSRAFDECYGLESITLGSGIKTIGNEAFTECSNLSDVYYTGDVNKWCQISFDSSLSNPLANEANLYFDNSLVSSVDLTDISLIGQYTFTGCNSLMTIIGNKETEGLYNTTFLNTGFYNNADNWENGILRIEDAIIAIADDAIALNMTAEDYFVPGVFPMKSRDLEITVDENNAHYYTDDYGTLYYDSTLLFLPLHGKTNSLIISDNIEHVNSGNFAHSYDIFTEEYRYPHDFHNDNGYENIENLFFGKGIKLLETYNMFPNLKEASGWCGDNVKWKINIETGEFHLTGTGDTWDYESRIYEPWGCFAPQIKKIVIDEGITSIGDRFFAYPSATELNLPDSIERLGKYSLAFSNFEKIYIQENIIKIDEGFSDSAPIREFYVNPQNQYFSSDEYGVLYNKNKTELVAYPEGSYFKQYNVLDGTVKINGNFPNHIYVPKTVGEINAHRPYQSIFYFEGSAEEWNKIKFPENFYPEEYTVYFNCKPLTLQDYPVTTIVNGSLDLDISYFGIEESTIEDTQEAVIWSIEDESIASITPQTPVISTIINAKTTAKIDGLAPGKTIIHVKTSNGREYSAELIVLEKISFSKDDYTFKKDEVASMTGEIILADEDEVVLEQICRNLSVECTNTGFGSTTINSDITLAEYKINPDKKSAEFTVTMTRSDSDYVRCVVSLGDWFKAKTFVKWINEEDLRFTEKNTNKFLHYYTLFFNENEKESDAYPIENEQYWRALEQMSNYSKINAVSKEKVYSSNEYEDWEGACFGLSLSIISKFNHFMNVPIKYYDGTVEYPDFYSEYLPPADHKEIRDIINFYHLLQYEYKPTHSTYNPETPSRWGGLIDSPWSDRDMISGNFWNALAVEAAQNISYIAVKPILLTYQYYYTKNEKKKSGGHAVIIYGFSENDTNYIFNVYDPNNYSSSGTIFSEIVVNKEDYSFSYTDRSHNIADCWYSFDYYDVNTVESMCKAMNTPSEINLLSASDTASFTIGIDETFSLYNAEGESLSFNGTDYVGDMDVSDFRLIGNDNGSCNVVFDLNNSDTFVLESDSDSTAFSIATDEYFYKIDAENSERITITPNDVFVGGEQINATVWASADSTNCQLVKLNISTADNVTISSSDGRINCSSDNVMTNLSASAYYHNSSVDYEISDNNSIEILTNDTAIHKVTFAADGEEYVRIVKDGDTLTDIPQVPQKKNYTGSWDRTDFSNVTEDMVVNVIWEPLPHTESIVTSFGKRYVVDTSIFKLSDSTIFVAGYKNRKLMQVKSADSSKANETLEFYGDFDAFKIMAWDSLSGLRPLCESEIIISD